MTVFDKPALSPAEHVGKLRERGLHIGDEPRVLRHLANISYYRSPPTPAPFTFRAMPSTTSNPTSPSKI